MKTKLLFLTALFYFSASSGSDKYDMGILLSAGEGYEREIGSGYSQNIQTVLLTGYVRDFDDNSHFANYYFMDLRFDSIHFTNTTYFLYNDALTNYNVDADLLRLSYRLGYEKQFLVGKKPEKRNLGFGAGFFYEGTLYMERNGFNRNYELDEEINRHNLGFIFTTELKLGWFVCGYKYEDLFFDMLNHDHINELQSSHNNASELRGLNLSPETSYFYCGINITF